MRLNAAVEPAFHQAWAEAAEAEAAGSRPKDLTWQFRARFAGTLQTATLALFDELAPAAGVEHRNPWNRAEARHLLVLHLSGRTKRGRKLYADTLPGPGPGRYGPRTRIRAQAPAAGLR